ncbi:MAG TPA: FAD-dependent oxidoreductase [Anaerolineae bacterium]
MEETKKPVIVAVDDDANALERLEQELRKRYAADYEIHCARSPAAALHTLEEMQAAGDQVAVLVASCWLLEMDSTEFIQRAHTLYPNAKRALLLKRGDRSATQLVLEAMALGIIDAYGLKPFPGDERFHHLVSEFLEEWAREHQPQYEAVQVIGERWSRRSYELRDLLERNSIPYGFYDADSEEGRAMLERSQNLGAALPVVIVFDGPTLANPSNAELAEALGVRTAYDVNHVTEGQVVDVVVVGAGPAGLSAAVYGASEGLHTVIIEREGPGGQAGMSSRIRNYLGFPNGISGAELAGRAYWQAWLFGANFIFIQEAAGLRIQGNDRVVILSDGTEVVSRTVILAMGASYRRLEIPSLDDLIGAGVFYGAVSSEAMALQDQGVFVVGGGNSAGQAVVHLARYARRVTMLVRGESLAATMSEYLIKEIENKENIELRLHTEVIDGGGDYRLERIVLRDTRSGQTETLPATALFVLIGATPRTEWLPPTIERDEQGYIVTGQDLLRDGSVPPEWPLQRPPFLLETSIPQVFAAGDVRHRSVKRVASAVGEGSIAVQLIHHALSE